MIKAIEWINDLSNNGYKYMFAKKGNKREVYATKADMKRGGGFRVKDDFDVFELEKEEEFPLKTAKLYDIRKTEGLF